MSPEKIPTADSKDEKIIFWHRELPPVDAELVGDHTVEATSGRVAGNVARGDAWWDRCYEELMAHAHDRLAQEVTRLHGDYAHVTDESIASRHDDAKGEGWLHGVFTYGLYRRPHSKAGGNP